MARAKKTARAEARRRYRAEHGLPEEPLVEDLETEARGTGRTERAATSGGPPQRIGIGAAFRQSFRPLDIRGDLQALPHIALRTKALWVPLLVTIASAVVFAVTRGTDILSQFLFSYFIQTPAIGGVFIAGFLAPRASWLLGVIVGLVSAVGYSIIGLGGILPVSPETNVNEVVLAAFALSPVMGALFASAAAWYRRFLALSNPNRGRAAQPARRGDGRSRSTGGQKAATRR